MHERVDVDCTGQVGGSAQYDTFCGRDRILGSCMPENCDVFQTNGGENCNCVCTGGDTGVDSFATLGIDTLDDCGDCWGAWASDADVMFEYGIETYFNDGDKGCGCGQDRPILHYVDFDGDAYDSDGSPSPMGDVDATQPYYFCVYNEPVDVISAYGVEIQYPADEGKELIGES